jgi:hypothetical protein
VLPKAAREDVESRTPQTHSLKSAARSIPHKPGCHAEAVSMQGSSCSCGGGRLRRFKEHRRWVLGEATHWVRAFDASPGE